MVAEYTYTNSAKSDPCHQFRPERRQARKAKSGRVLRKVCHFGVWPTGGRVVLIYSHVARHIAWDGLDEYEAYSTTKDHSLVAVYGGYARRLFRHLPTGGVSSTNHLENKT